MPFLCAPQDGDSLIKSDHPTVLAVIPLNWALETEGWYERPGWLLDLLYVSSLRSTMVKKRKRNREKRRDEDWRGHSPSAIFLALVCRDVRARRVDT